MTSPVSIYPDNICQILESPQYYAEIGIKTLCLAFFPLFFFPVQFGKLKTSTLTFDLSPEVGWFIMEAPAWIVYALVTYFAIPEINHTISLKYTKFEAIPEAIQLWSLLFCVSGVLYAGHYFYRSMIYPHLLSSKKPMEAYPALLACFFNIANGLNHSHNIFCIQTKNVNEIASIWLYLGTIMFIACWLSCHWSDMHLASLRPRNVPPETGNNQQQQQQQQQQQHESGNDNKQPIVESNTGQKKADPYSHYVIPTRGFFKYMYTPNYFFELMQWVSFYILTQFARSSLLFVILTFANLFPRAVSYSKFYRKMEQERKED